MATAVQGNAQKCAGHGVGCGARLPLPAEGVDAVERAGEGGRASKNWVPKKKRTKSEEGKKKQIHPIMNESAHEHGITRLEKKAEDKEQNMGRERARKI